MKKPRFQTTESKAPLAFRSGDQNRRIKILENERDLRKVSEKPKSAEAILADPLVVGGIVDIDEHVLVGMSG